MDEHVIQLHLRSYLRAEGAEAVQAGSAVINSSELENRCPIRSQSVSLPQISLKHSLYMQQSIYALPAVCEHLTEAALVPVPMFKWLGFRVGDEQVGLKLAWYDCVCKVVIIKMQQPCDAAQA
jgi:hypothetical protein